MGARATGAGGAIGAAWWAWREVVGGTACDDGVTGTGVCTCAPNHYGADCAVYDCPFKDTVTTCPSSLSC